MKAAALHRIPGLLAALLLASPSAAALTRPAGIAASAPAPSAIADRAVLTVSVAAEGVQRLSGAALAAAGLNIAALDPARIQLWRADRPVSLDERGTQDGRLDPGDELRFYAPAPGDRWNAADTYWLTFEDAPAVRMAVRDVTPATAPPRTAALEAGVWRASQLYDSTQPGPDGDHWFAADLRAGPGLTPAALAVPLDAALPPAAGPFTVTVAGAAYTHGAHTLDIRAGGETRRARWSGAGAWSHTVTFAAPAAGVELALVPGDAPDGVEIDSVTWQRAAVLAAAGRGAHIATPGGSARYQLAGLAAGQELYDITDPSAPVRLTGLSGGAFEDQAAPRRYLLTGAGTLHAPAASAHTPRLLPAAADVVYIAPAALHPALAPLLAHRTAQGYLAAAVDVQAIYDRWSGGMVDPEAIRSFLRHAATWDRPPRAAVLVGDGSSDPLDRAGYGSPGLIPPYLATVDPWLGETACETCYAQLDGDDPLSDPLPDIAIGRLPVNGAAELRALAAKLIAYDTGAAGEWRARVVLLADNGAEADGAADTAGDFAAQSDALLPLVPAGADVRRVYFDPSPGAARTPWREPDARRARERARAAINEGAGLVVYTGHGHQWQWAVTDPALEDGALLHLYDAYALTNRARLPIVLAMTCLSSAFHTPSYSGTTLDERLVLHAGGGAVAVWGPAGMSVAAGHDALARGFLRELWRDPSRRPTLGDLTLAGYRELVSAGQGGHETLRTYVLLGDPLTPAQATPGARVFLPAVQR